MLNDELERIYREANDIPAGKRAPLTTEAVFKAMRAAITTEREACAKVCDDEAKAMRREGEGSHGAQYDWMAEGAERCADELRANVKVSGLPQAEGD